jgi:hypothetical protein
LTPFLSFFTQIIQKEDGGYFLIYNIKIYPMLINLYVLSSLKVFKYSSDTKRFINKTSKKDSFAPHSENPNNKLFKPNSSLVYCALFGVYEPRKGFLIGDQNEKHDI